jgi:fructoselysine 6-phosphate deglycase
VNHHVSPDQAASLPLRRIEPDFVDVTAAALADRDVVRRYVHTALDQGIDSVFFVGAGGSWASSVPAEFTLKNRLTELYVDNVPSSEILSVLPTRLSSNSLVVISSHSGGTSETVAAARKIRETGARMISLSSETDSPLGELADLALGYHSDRTITSAKQILLSHITWALMRDVSDEAEQDAVLAAYTALPTALWGMLESADDKLRSVAELLVDNELTYVLSSGPNVGVGYLLSMCYLIEMQWIRSAHFNAGEFFHGAFELVGPKTAVVTFLGEDHTRAVAERAHRFAENYSGVAIALDSKDFALEGVAAAQRAEVTPIVLGVLAWRLADQLEAVTGHSLDERRYMHRVEY